MTPVPFIFRFIVTTLVAIIAISASASQARTTDLDDAAIAALYRLAIEARLSNRPDVAEAVLTKLLDLRPNVPQLWLDLGVAQAEQGDCRRARRTLDRSATLAQLPAFDRAVEQAMQDLCPSLAPWETDLAIEFIYDSNINGGTRSRYLEVNGVTYRLNDDAMAETGFGFRVNARAAFNAKVADSFYVVPALALERTDLNGNDYDLSTAKPSISLRYRGDIVDIRAGPELRLIRTNTESVQRGMALNGVVDVTLSALTGLRITAEHGWIEEIGDSNYDRVHTHGSVSYVRGLNWNNAIMRLTVHMGSSDYENNIQDIDSYGIILAGSASLMPQIGLALELGYTELRGRNQNAFFGERRQDEVFTSTANVSFAQFETQLGRPFVGATYQDSRSNFATQVFDRRTFNFGLTKRF